MGLHVGYRRLRQGGGTWVGRRFCSGRYNERQLGTADDLQEADGTVILSFRHAQDAARAWWKAELRVALGLEPVCGAYSVAMALEDYIQDYLRRGGRDLQNIRSIASAHILPALGSLDTVKLTTKRIREWHHRLATSPRLTRGSRNPTLRLQAGLDVADPETVRKRRSRANRVLTVLKAALNHAFAEHRIGSDEPWRRVAPFRGVDVARIHYLNGTECQRLINACDQEFRQLVRAAILTGARYGELIRLRVSDVDLEAGTIHIRESKSGKPRQIPLTDEASEHFEQLVLGRGGCAAVFVRSNGRVWKRSEQARPLLSACRRAGIEPAITFHGLRDTFASVLAMNGAPMAVIARVLGHSDTRVTEKHYAHLAPNYVAESLRTHFPRLSPPLPVTLVAIGAR
jgi:integrase